MNSLETLYLFDNMITGNIPVELGKLQKLSSIYLYDNQFLGSIPRELTLLQLIRD